MVLDHKTLKEPAKGWRFLMEAADGQEMTDWLQWFEKVVKDPEFEMDSETKAQIAKEVGSN